MPSDEYANRYDEKCLPLVNLYDASRCISAIIFQEISMNPDLDDKTWIFLNPNANNKMPRYLADSFTFHNNALMDAFAYDNY